ncbi:MAG: DNA polymerase III subunit gamma/tau, partial [SAR202 cluster bacterium]|nr:DNA polymerase III subunit gamma/tau [SAR202 cluster bacterium]
MSEVLYRKWRPRRLEDVVGQEPVTQTLTRAVSLGRVAHAYLFCGPRGTGKTSTARILAKAVNCLAPAGGEPDDTCGMCLAINEGRALDLIEIDAASNRGIDDIRSLRDKVNFSPNEARSKVYIVDEVHMLTKEAFNALLKTLEEPPPHAIFVLATTEAHKIPATIISRCQRFDFRRIGLGAIVGRLKTVCEGEGIEAETGALELIAKTAAGGLRDAINLLEQALVSYGSPITEQHVRDLLGLETDEAALSLAGHALARSTQEGLKLVNEVLAQGSDLRQLHRATVENLRVALLIKSGAGAPPGFSKEAAERLRDFTSQATLDQVVHTLKCFAKADMRREGASPLPLELALVESALEQPAPARPA